MIKEKRDNFIAAYNKYADQIFRYCFFRVYSESLAEELTQETFLKAWKYMQNEREVRNLQAFLYQISRNLITDVYRRKKVRLGGEESLDSLIELKGNSAEPVYDGKNALESQIMVDETMELIYQLPTRYRDILILRYVENMPPKEIAKGLKSDPRNISTQIKRALRKIKENSISNKLKIKYEKNNIEAARY